MIFGIRADLVLEHGKRTRIRKNYSWIESKDLSRHEVIIELRFTYTILGFGLGYVEPRQGYQVFK